MLQQLKYLKNKLAASNIISLSIILIAIFTSVYFIMRGQMINQEYALLSSVAQKENEDGYYKPPIVYEHPETENSTLESAGLSVDEIAISLFYIKTNVLGETIDFSGDFIQREEFIKSLIQLANEKHENHGDINYVHLKFAYYILESPNGGCVYVFTDRSIRDRTMMYYVYVAIIGLILSLGGVFLISFHLAGKAISPVREFMEKQEKFISDASHELRTPLAVIRSNTEMIMDVPYQTVEENMKWLEYIHKESKRMAKMTEELLAISKADSIFKSSDEKKKNAPQEELNLSVLTLGIYDSFMKFFEEHGLYNNTRNIEQNIVIMANENQIRQLITILLDNAIKYTEEGGISVSLTNDADFAYLKVTDSGQGMPEEILDKIFDRFFRADKARSRAQGGAGLGLSIAKIIADEHKAQILVESKLGKGSTFCVKFPLVKHV